MRAFVSVSVLVLLPSDTRIKCKRRFTQHERSDLQAWAHSRSLPHIILRRAQTILMSASGINSASVATNFHMSCLIVAFWPKRYLAQGITGPYGDSGPGRPRSYQDQPVADLINKVSQEKPKMATNWSVRLAASETGISKSTVQRYLHLFSVQPQGSNSFKLFNDPQLTDKVRDCVDLYLSLPDKAPVPCVDEKTQI